METNLVNLYSTEIWVKFGFFYCHVFALDSSWNASNSHISNIVFATATPTVIPEGNAKRGESCLFLL